MEKWASELMAKAPGGVGVGALSYKAPKALWPAEAVTDGTMADTEAVQRATELIDQRLAEEEENEVWAGVWGPEGVVRRSCSAVKGRESLAATLEVGRGQVFRLLPFLPQVFLAEGFADNGRLRLQPQELRDCGVGEPSWAP